MYIGKRIHSLGRLGQSMVYIPVQVERCTTGGGYILWERLGQSTHGGVPCTGGEVYGGRRILYLGKVGSERTWWSSMYRW